MPLGQALTTVLAMFNRRRGVILAAFVVIFLPAAAFILLSPKKYAAESTVLVRFGREHALQSYGEGDRPLPINYAQDQLVSSATEIMGSRVLAQRTVDNIGYSRIYPKLCEAGLLDRLTEALGLGKTGERCQEPAYAASEQLQKDVKVAAAGRSNIIEARFAHEDPAIAAEVLNNFVDSFQAIYKPLYLEHPIPTLEAEVERARQRLTLAEQRIVGFESDTFSFEGDGQLEVLLLRRTRLEQQLSKLQACCLGTAAAQAAAQEIGTINAEIVETNGDRAHLRDLLRERQTADQHLSGAINRLRDAENMKELENSNVSGLQVISRADPPTETVRPGSLVRLVLAAAFAMLAAAAGGLLLEVLRRRYSTPEEFEAAFNIPILANLPFESKRVS